MHAFGIGTVMRYGYPYGCCRKARFGGEGVKDVGDAHRTVVFPVGFAFAAAFGDVKRQWPCVRAFIEHGAKRDDITYVIVFCDT